MPTRMRDDKWLARHWSPASDAGSPEGEGARVWSRANPRAPPPGTSGSSFPSRQPESGVNSALMKLPRRTSPPPNCQAIGGLRHSLSPVARKCPAGEARTTGRPPDTRTMPGFRDKKGSDHGGIYYIAGLSDGLTLVAADLERLVPARASTSEVKRLVAGTLLVSQSVSRAHAPHPEGPGSYVRAMKLPLGIISFRQLTSPKPASSCALANQYESPSPRQMGQWNLTSCYYPV